MRGGPSQFPGPGRFGSPGDVRKVWCPGDTKTSDPLKRVATFRRFGVLETRFEGCTRAGHETSKAPKQFATFRGLVPVEGRFEVLFGGRGPDRTRFESLVSWRHQNLETSATRRDVSRVWCPGDTFRGFVRAGGRRVLEGAGEGGGHDPVIVVVDDVPVRGGLEDGGERARGRPQHQRHVVAVQHLSHDRSASSSLIESLNTASGNMSARSSTKTGMWPLPTSSMKLPITSCVAIRSAVMSV